MAKWKKEALEAVRLIRKVRRSGETEPLALVQEAELQDMREWVAKRDYENQLMQLCIAGMIQGRSPCWWCEECKECKREQHMKQGCGDWWLRFLTEQEERHCMARAIDGFTMDAVKAAAKTSEITAENVKEGRCEHGNQEDKGADA